MGGWYELQNKEFIYLEDITFLAAMGPPSQGRNSISFRTSRHFNQIYTEPL
jgi:dynein heavy chain